jgi:gas vesicle protein
MYEDIDTPEPQDSPDLHDEQTARAHGMRSLGLGLLLGAALGAGMALLFAPQSGETTRRQLRRGARKLYRQGGGVVTDWWDETERGARQLSRQGMRRGRKAASRLRERVRDRARDLADW